MASKIWEKDLATPHLELGRPGTSVASSVVVTLNAPTWSPHHLPTPSVIKSMGTLSLTGWVQVLMTSLRSWRRCLQFPHLQNGFNNSICLVGFALIVSAQMVLLFSCLIMPLGHLWIFLVLHYYLFKGITNWLFLLGKKKKVGRLCKPFCRRKC